ncbi:MAG: quinolinate synthase NadA [Candidatus Cloacimonetes bacterium]|nr:quinolinate synthase NadA [Candidatus Cloacimonadota bacterium]
MEIISEIKRLKAEKNALILAHNYQDISILEVADFTGDSLQLSIRAREVETGIIVFCGVRFMAETAAVLNPRAKVLLPVADAGCPMADMITAEELRVLKSKYPGAVVVCYVNSTLEVKAESDICCTSSNAVRVIRSIPPDQQIIFVPDQNLGSWAALQTGREMIIHSGYCVVHQWGFTLGDVKRMRDKYPEHKLIAHPECTNAILQNADEVMSTSGMMAYAQDQDKLIFATEVGLIDYLNHLHPGKSLVALSHRAICKNMKKTHLKDVLSALQQERHHVKPEAGIAAKALCCLERMLAL